MSFKADTADNLLLLLTIQHVGVNAKLYVVLPQKRLIHHKIKPQRPKTMTKSTATTSETKPISKKKIRPLKKAPQAPKRFKSSYILFFIHVQENIKKSLPQGHASVSEMYCSYEERFSYMRFSN